MPPVYDQSALGSCTAQMTAAAVDADCIVNGEPPLEPSRLWLYSLARLYGGLPLNEDTGAYCRDAYKSARRQGVIPEDLWPYSIDFRSWSRNPRESEHWQNRDKIDRPYKRVPQNLASIKRVLSNKQTIGFGFAVFESFESEQVARTGIMPHPNVARERLLGGHAVLLVGYLKSHPDYALIRNSWSARWGIGGYFLMPWSVVLDPSLSRDFRTIYRPAK